MKFTDGAIEALAPAASDQYFWDSELRRFGVRVTPRGARVYLVQYRAKAAAGAPSKTRKISIGQHDGKLWNVAKARAAARKYLATVDLGGDPFTDRASALAAEAAQVEEDARRERDRFETVVDRYAKAALKDSRSGQEVARLLRHGAVPKWTGRHVADIRRGEVAELIDEIKARSPATARLTFAALRGLFSWAAERELLDISPCERVTAPPRPPARDRVLSDAELRAIWQGAEALGYPFGPIVKLLILTGQRRAEVAGMGWSEIDLDARTWRIPKERAKNVRAHEIDLGPEVMAILEAIPRTGDLLFPARKAPARVGDAAGRYHQDPGAARGFSATKRRLDELAAAEGAKEPWRLHDLRRTAATGMAGLGAAPHVIERILNHVSGVQGGLVGVYQRHEYRPERKTALLDWGKHVAAIVAPKAPADNVEPIAPRLAASREARRTPGPRRRRG